MWTSTIEGRLGKDPEIKEHENGNRTKFSVAVGWKDRGEDKTEWVRCTAWGRTGEVIAEYFHKGDQIMVTGRMTTNEWVSDDGERKDVELNVTDFAFGAKARGNDDEGY